MYERKRDQELGIKTVGIREWSKKEQQYHRYEATPYKALDQLANHYPLNENHAVVDFGAGRGRVSFYLHHRFKSQVVGVEVNDTTLDEAIANKANYKNQFNLTRQGKLRFDFGLAEQYPISKKKNCFYFFNPFSYQIYCSVFKNITRSFQKKPRPMDIIIYYPMPEVIDYLKRKTPFKLHKKIPAFNAHGKHGMFKIFRAGYKEVA